jgi:Fur family ferric uptake transcriptional regulator
MRLPIPGSPALYEDRVGDNHHHVIRRTCPIISNVSRTLHQTTDK